jgi:hypothetical protein
MGLPVLLDIRVSERQPAELKHLSKQRKRNQTEIPLVKAIEKGIGQTESAPKWCRDVEFGPGAHPQC